MKVLFLLLVSSLFCLQSLQATPLDSIYSKLCSGQTEQVTQACQDLVQLNAAETYPLILNLLQRKPYQFQDYHVPALKLTRGQRRLFTPILSGVYLVSGDTLLQQQAFQEVQAKRQTQYLPVLEQMFAQGKLPASLQAQASSSLHTLYLFVPDPTLQGKGLDYFTSLEDDYDYQSLYQDYLKQPELMPTLRKQAERRVNYNAMLERNNNIFQNLFSGLSLGSILVLIAIGLSIIYGLVGVINMSHGEFIMIGAYTTYGLQQLFEAFLPASWFDYAFFLALPLSFVIAALFGLVMERLVIRHLYNRPLESLLATLGISLILIQLARSLFGDLTTVRAPEMLMGGIEVRAGLIFPYNRLFIIGLTIVLVLGVYLLFQRTRLGVKIRAVTQNRNMSASVGISTQKVDMITFMLGSGLAGIAGCAVTLIGNVVPSMGQTYIVDSFLVVVSGGVGQLIGCITSGLGIGVLSKIFEAGFEAVYGKVLILLLIIVFLQWRPKGLFADKGRIGDD